MSNGITEWEYDEIAAETRAVKGNDELDIMMEEVRVMRRLIEVKERLIVLRRAQLAESREHANDALRGRAEQQAPK